MADVTKPRFDFHMAVFEKSGIGVDIETIRRCGFGSGEVEKTIPTVPNHIVGAGAETGDGGIGIKGTDNTVGGCGAEKNTVLVGIKPSVNHGEIAESPREGYTGDRRDRDRRLGVDYGQKTRHKDKNRYNR